MSFSKESLEELRARVDLVEVLSPYLKMQRAGASYKALCPFHEEKTPSFVVQKGDRHYHCFGCGAHGDAMQFLMTYLKMSFVESVEHLAERFHVQVERTHSEERSSIPKAQLKEVLEKAVQFYQFYLLSTHEGHQALRYLYQRGIDLEFIQTFNIGLAPKDGSLFLKVMQEQKVSLEQLHQVGLYSKTRVFFTDRITFPIRDAVGGCIGFSCRKYKEETFGGKYINSPETQLFKKSRILFGLSYSRKNIAKKKEVLIVEGQLDVLRLIQMGFDWSVAGQGTAFTDEMVREVVQLGARKIFLAFDGDTAGRAAAVKVGDLFQKEGLEVFVLSLEEGMDPDLFLREQGPIAWQSLLDSAKDYLTFLIEFSSEQVDMDSPAEKASVISNISARIRSWDHPIMVHESLRKLARLMHMPETMIDSRALELQVKRSSHIEFEKINPDRILEADLLRWMLLMGETLPQMLQIAEDNLELNHFRTAEGRRLYEKYMQAAKENTSRELLSLAIDFQKEEEQTFLEEVLNKKVNQAKALPLFIDTVQKLLERHWMHCREEVKMQIYSGRHSEEEVLELARQFDILKKQRPEVKINRV